MYPQQEVGVVGRIGTAGDGIDASNVFVDSTDTRCCCVRRRRAAEHDREHVFRRAPGTHPRVVAEIAVLVDRRHRDGV
jgi:hypothetical protein